MKNHDEHVLKYVMLTTDIQQDAQITEDGDVEVTGDISIIAFSGDHFIYCDTCEERIVSGEGGLDEFWEVR
jgi:hypothetical protein